MKELQKFLNPTVHGTVSDAEVCLLDGWKGEKTRGSTCRETSAGILTAHLLHLDLRSATGMKMQLQSFLRFHPLFPERPELFQARKNLSFEGLPRKFCPL